MNILLKTQQFTPFICIFEVENASNFSKECALFARGRAFLEVQGKSLPPNGSGLWHKK